MSIKRSGILLALGAGLVGVGEFATAGPVAVGESTITVSYPTDSGVASFSDNRDFRGVYFPDAQPLGTAPNIKAFQSTGAYGRRVNVASQFPEVIGANETVVAHAFLKLDNNGDYFPGITENGTVTVRVDNIRFSEAVDVVEDTFLLHTFWDLAQSDQLHHYYDHEHNLHTLTDSFRDEHEFHMAHEIMNTPMPHHVFGDLAPLVTITGQGTDTLGLLVEIPYEMFMHLHEHGQMVPDGLPAPHGFLEPYHFHLEYVVASVPEPGIIFLFLAGGAALIRRRAA